MSNRLALILALLILAIFAGDRIWFSGELPLALGRRLAAAIEWLSFWR